jgi:hypothetical protein
MKIITTLFLLLTTIVSSQNVQNVFPEMLKEFTQVRDFEMTTNQGEIYFTVDSFKKEYSFIAFTKKVNNQWTEPAVVSFSGRYKDLEPFLSPNGLNFFLPQIV